jgi:phage gpG-like protein
MEYDRAAREGHCAGSVVADKIDVQILGLDELVTGSRRLFGQIEKGADKRFARVAERRARIARGSIPRVSGALAGSVSNEKSDVLFGGDLPYAGWVEFGGDRGRPYMPEGRYFYPVTTQNAESELEHEGTIDAQNQTRGFPWPSPH